MKAVNVIIKIVVALAAIAGIVYLAATYGDKIVAWAKKMLGRIGCCCCDGECECECSCDDCDCECCCDEAEELTEEITEEAAEEPAEEAPVAAEQDFEG